MQKKRIAEANKAVGKPKVGGSFQLIDQDGKPFTDADLKGKYSLVRTPQQPSWCVCQTAADIQCLSLSPRSALLWLHTLPRYLP